MVQGDVLTAARDGTFVPAWSPPVLPTSGRWVLALAAFLLGVIAAETIVAEEPDHPPRPPLPEQILTESVTDLDAIEPGETEFALNGQTLEANTGSARAWQASVEAEWRATSHLGLRLEPSYASLIEEGRTNELGLQAAAAWGLFHDFAHDLHVQIEATARFTGNDKPYESQPGDFSLPFATGLRFGKRFGPLTLRPGFGTEIGSTPAHLPYWFGMGALYALGDGGRFGFAGVEVDADAARQTPFIVAPNFMADTKAIGLPFRLGLAVPYVLGAASREPSLGVYLRLLVRTEVD